ncbi:hypothetical protein SLNWT_1241 [Streptomyces albus]|uniref:Uncharacterized protein n=1 Tax=Streptomyces albus (strain ATCC 21838 / DSM 41398 / FERM P-419 / JCM 4703 / NBRC 107858) TaxID=1081613 RepID=A0A0B5EU22_STRA4|nr:hypothetical protein SLNWT_1241 [Streptomyces albus]AOU75932.1 hypothetical protein SLNHY_1241 [Streptomyces albus]
MMRQCGSASRPRGPPGAIRVTLAAPLEQDFLIEITSCDTSLARQSALDAREEPRARAAY